MSRSAANPKSQAPNPKQESKSSNGENEENDAACSGFGIWNLEIGICLGFGAWDLGFAERLRDLGND
jgi:hypothetical protein